jgi:hypothetical protein
MDIWSEHFVSEATQILGKTPVGRVTVHVLALNASDQVIIREALLQ